MNALDWHDRYLTWLQSERRKHGRRGHLAQASLLAYRADMQDMCRWFALAQDKAFSPDLLTEQVLESYIANLKQLRRSPATINRRLAGLRLLVYWAQHEGLLSTDPTDAVERQEVETLPRDKTDDEYDALKDSAARGAHLRRHTPRHGLLALRDRIIFGLYAQAGLRCAEAAALDVHDVDIDGLTIRVRNGKGGTDKPVHIPAELAAQISTWLGLRPPASDALLSDWAGKRVSAGQLRRRLEMIGEAVGIHVTPHDLRHTHGCRLFDSFIEQGADVHAALDAVRRQLRHKDERTTLGYLRARRSQIVAAVDAAA
jgi:integrase